MQEDTTRTYLFENAHGQPFTKNRVEQYFSRLAKRSGIKFHPHMLRHTFATTVMAKNANVFAVKDIMGHSSLQTTMKYTHLSPADLKKYHSQFSPINDIM